MPTDITSLFDNVNSLESYTILFWLFLSFLLGLLAGLLARSGTIRRLRTELEEQKSLVITAQAEASGWREQVALKEADLKKLEYEKEMLENQMSNSNSEALELELNKAKALIYQHEYTIEQLKAQIDGAGNSRNFIPNPGSQPMLPDTEFADTNNTAPSGTDEALPRLGVDESILQRLEQLEAQMNQLATENEALRMQVTTNPSLDLAGAFMPAVEPPAMETLPELSNEKNILLDRIVVGAPNRASDDLTRIEGIGPFLQKQLNDLGIYSYEQIANWSEADILDITRAIAYLPGQIQKDNWPGQARLLMEQNTPVDLVSPSAIAAVEASTLAPVETVPILEPEMVPHPTSIGKIDDLKQVEGIGPKLEGILKSAGILTLVELAQTDPEKIKNILLQVNDNYRIHDPSTWPTQALLAVNGDWHLLKEYQEQLKGGREVS